MNDTYTNIHGWEDLCGFIEKSLCCMCLCLYVFTRVYAHALCEYMYLYITSICDIQYPLSYEHILALFLYTVLYVVVFYTLELLAWQNTGRGIPPPLPPCSYGHVRGYVRTRV